MLLRRILDAIARNYSVKMKLYIILILNNYCPKVFNNVIKELAKIKMMSPDVACE